MLNGQEIEISPFILDRNNNSKEWNGLTIQKPMEKFIENFENDNDEWINTINSKL